MKRCSAIAVLMTLCIASCSSRWEEAHGVMWQDKVIGSDVWIHDNGRVLYQVTHIPDGVVVAEMQRYPDAVNHLEHSDYLKALIQSHVQHNRLEALSAIADALLSQDPQNSVGGQLRTLVQDAKKGRE